MTGFASVGREEAGERVAVTVKTVNHRFLDVAVKAPHALGAIESRLKAAVQSRLARGRVELTISADAAATAARDVVFDEALVERISAALAPLRARGLVSGKLDVSDLLRLPQVFEIRARAPGAAAGGVPDTLAALVERTVAEAIDAVVVMRETEGRFLATDLDARLGTIGAFVDEVTRVSADAQRALDLRLRERLAALPPDVAGEPAAVAQEIVRFVARSDIDEEVVRLRGHIEHWRKLAEGDEPCGRKLDFLVQELNREINTIGSKVEGPRATELVVGAKAELERIREQVQNVE